MAVVGEMHVGKGKEEKRTCASRARGHACRTQDARDWPIRTREMHMPRARRLPTCAQLTRAWRSLLVRQAPHRTKRQRTWC